MIRSIRGCSFLLFSCFMLIIAGLYPVFSQAAGKTPKSNKISIAVSELDGRGLQPGEASTLTDALSSHLSNTGKFRVLERGKMDVVLKEQGFQQSGACTDEACIVEMGQLLGVDHMVTGSIGKVGKTYSVNVRMISVATGEIVRTISKNFKGEIDGLLTDILPVIAEEFAVVKEPAPVVVTKTEPVSTVTAQPAKSEPVKSEPEVKSEGKGMSPVLVVVIVAAVVGGGAAAFLILSKKDDSKSSDNSGSPGNSGTQTGTVDITW